MKKKVIVASALFAALVMPAFAFSTTQTETETQSASITIDKAVGATPAASLTVSSNASPTAPASGTAGSATNIDTNNVAAVYAWSNHANWDAYVTGASLSRTGPVALSAAAQVAPYTGSCGSFVNIPTTGITGVTRLNGTKNTDNNGQTVASCIRQPISWTDEPGTYTSTLTHSVVSDG